MPFAVAFSPTEVAEITSLAHHLPDWEVTIRDHRTGAQLYLNGVEDDYYIDIPNGLPTYEIKKLLVFLRGRGLLVLPEHEHPTEYLGDRMRVYMAPIVVAV